MMIEVCENVTVLFLSPHPSVLVRLFGDSYHSVLFPCSRKCISTEIMTPFI